MMFVGSDMILIFIVQNRFLLSTLFPRTNTFWISFKHLFVTLCWKLKKMLALVFGKQASMTTEKQVNSSGLSLSSKRRDQLKTTILTLTYTPIALFSMLLGMM